MTVEEGGAVVRFLKRYDIYNQGETAGLNPNKAARLAKMGACEIVIPPYEGWTPDVQLQITASQPNGPEESTLLIRQKLMQAVSYVPAKEREKDGRPRTDSLSRITGIMVNNEARDLAWEQWKKAYPVEAKAFASAKAA